MKKFMALLLAVVMVVSMLPMTMAADVPEAEVKQLDPMEVNWKHVFTGGLSNDTEVYYEPLDVVMEFKAKDDENTVKDSKFAKYYADFVIKIEGFNGVLTDSYLGGNYGSFEWVKVPLNGIEIKDGAEYALLSTVLGPWTYEDICTYVGTFTCGMSIDKEILEKNPELKVTVELAVAKDDSVFEHDENLVFPNLSQRDKVCSYTYDVDDFLGNVVQLIGVTVEDGEDTIINPKYTSLEEAIKAIVKNNITECTIKLLDDIEVVPVSTMISFQLPENLKLTLDLNGHKITSSLPENSDPLNTNYAIMSVPASSSLTIKDSSSAKTGAIINNVDVQDSTGLGGTQLKSEIIKSNTTSTGNNVNLVGGTLTSSDTDDLKNINLSGNYETITNNDGSITLRPIIKGSSSSVPAATTYTVTFDANGGKCDVKSVSVEENSTLSVLPTAARAGYTFDGWYTAKNGGKLFDAKTAVDADITLYARWTAVEKEEEEVKPLSTSLVSALNAASRRFGITINSNEGGRVLGGKQILFGGKVTCVFMPNPGYKIASVVIDGEDMGEIDSYAFKNVKENHVVDVEFEKIS